MQIESIFSFLVHPSKNVQHQPEIGGTKLPLEGNLFNMLSTTFEKAALDCNIDITFTPSPEGDQFNQRRSEIITLLKHRNIDNARMLANHLQTVTTRRSGLGLLFIVLGSEESITRVYLARFPADIGIVAEENQNELSVELLERVFMKNAVAYKAVVFDGSNFDVHFWIGKAIDKQISNNSVAISSYWIREFLQADFKTTPAQGTRRLAIAIKQAMNDAKEIEIKEELAAAARLSKSLNGKIMSMDNFAEQFGLSDKTREAVVAKLAHPNLRFDQFQFRTKEFSKHIKYRSIQIDNGALLTATIGNFDRCFTKTPVADDSSEYLFTTQGTIVDESLRTSKS